MASSDTSADSSVNVPLSSAGFPGKTPSTRVFTAFRKVAFAEGVSFLLLLFVAMPLKYAADYPDGVRIAGSLHGLLFVAFIVLAFVVKSKFNRTWGWGLKAFVASIIPFGTFYMEKEWKRQELNIRK